MRIAAAVLALIVVVAVVAVVAMPRDVSVEKEGDGSLSFEGEKSLRAFGSLEIDIEPGEGCIAKVYLDGDEVASDVASYRYDAPFADFSRHEIKVVFERASPVPVPEEKVTLTVEKSEGGAVDPEGSSRVAKGTEAAIRITPDSGYVIDGITIDGAAVPVCNAIDLRVDADTAVSVTFRPAGSQDIPVTIDVDANIEIRTLGGDVDFGTIVPSGVVKVKPGSSLKISVLLNPGFEMKDFQVDGRSVGKVTEYTIEDIRSSVSVSVSVVKQVDGYTITASAGSGGKISPSGDVIVEKGKDVTFTFSANSGYSVSEVVVDGKKVTATGSYTFENVTSNHTISVAFKYTGGGSVTPSKTLTKIEVTKQPTKTAYWEGETFDASGMEVTTTYSDGSTKVLTSAQYCVSPSEMSKDTTQVTVSYGGKTCTVAVSVKYVKDLEIARKDGRDWYKAGETVTKDTLAVTATYSNDTTEVLSEYEIAPTAPLKAGDKLSVTYRGFTKTVNIGIYAFDSITAVTEKNTYLVDEPFDKGSITVKAIYRNGDSQKEETVNGFTIDPAKGTTAGSCTVTVTCDGQEYKDKTCTLALTIVDPTAVESIEVKSPPTKIRYFDDERFDSTGIEIEGTTAAGKVDISAESVTFAEGSADASGKVIVTVTYNGMTTTFEIYRTLEISDISGLKHFRDNVNGGTAYEGKTVTLATDIDLNREPWTPIGPNADESKKFKGTFDGGNHTISNLFVDTFADQKYRATGFFGALNGTVKNLKFENAEIRGFTGGDSTDNGIAVVAGSIYSSGSIANVEVTNSSISGNRYIGTIAGYVYGNITGCSVSDITIVATPNQKSDGTFDNGDKVGGIAGYWCSEKTYSLSDNKASRLTITAYRDVGGIVGAADGGNGDSIKMENNKVEALNITIDQRTNGYGDKEYNAGGICQRILRCSGSIPDSNTVDGFTLKIILDGGTIPGPDSGNAILDYGADSIEIELHGDCKIVANNPYLSLGSDDTENVSIKGVKDDNDGSEPSLTMTTSYWTRLYLTNGYGKLSISDLTMSGSQDAGTWNSYDITFMCDADISNVIFQKAVAIDGGARHLTVNMKGVTINETSSKSDCYALWISTGNAVSIEDSFIIGKSSAGNSNRAIKIDSQYDDEDTDRSTVLTLKNVRFESDKKSAVMVKNPGSTTTVNVDGTIDISGVKADSKNLVWIQRYSKVILTEGYKAINEPIASQSDFKNALNIVPEDTTLVFSAGTYVLESGLGGKTLTLTSLNEEPVIINMSSAIALHDSNLTFENLKFVYGNTNYVGLQHTDSVTYRNCSFEGQMFLYAENERFENCSFKQRIPIATMSGPTAVLM